MVADIEFDMIGDNKHLIAKKTNSPHTCKPLLNQDAIKNPEIFEAYCKLDGNAFGGMSAERWVKMDYCILGGFPVVMYLPTETTDPDLVNELGTKNQKYTPIGFMDMHLIGEGKTFLVSGLGIAKPYQGLGLSKYLISMGVHLSDTDKLKVPTQLSNKMAHYAWEHAGKMNLIYSEVPHDKSDTVVYEINTNYWTDIMQSLKAKDNTECPKTCLVEYKS